MEMSREIVVRNGVIAKRDVGVPDRGYCGLHDIEYVLTQGDEVCPDCDRHQNQSISWREEEPTDSFDEITGGNDEE